MPATLVAIAASEKPQTNGILVQLEQELRQRCMGNTQLFPIDAVASA